jgi:hypothetical protein
MKKICYLFSIIFFAFFLSGCQSQEDRAIAPQKKSVSWEFDGEKWNKSSSVPSCPEPLTMELPIDINLVSSVLYPGQYRSGDYKPHGGFRFDGKNAGDITVKAPMDARLIFGSRYIEQGDVQYLLWFENSCGVAYRFDHLLTLAPVFQKLAETLPPALPDDSRTARFTVPLEVKTGDIIATAVGLAKTQNIGVDWGVYDLRQPNAVSKNENFAEKHGAEKEQTFYGICWFDFLSADMAQKIRALPSTGTGGKVSDYCI